VYVCVCVCVRVRVRVCKCASATQDNRGSTHLIHDSICWSVHFVNQIVKTLSKSWKQTFELCLCFGIVCRGTMSHSLVLVPASGGENKNEE
jgi:hypothetical protein